MLTRDPDRLPAVLDWAHRTTLRAVARGDCDDSPALRTLLATGLAEQAPDGGCTVTAAGRLALEAGEWQRWERIVYPFGAVCGAVLVVGTVVSWFG